MTDWLNPAEMKAWRSFIETVYDLTAALERDLSELNMTLGDYQVLVFLSEVEDQAMRMVDLSERLQLSPSGLTRRLDGLVRAEMVLRRPSSSDGRVMMAVLTEHGRSTLEAIAPHHVSSVRRRVFDHLEPHHIDSMAEIFAAISAGLGKPTSA